MGDQLFEASVTIRNRLGMHARAATRFVQLASKYPCEVGLSKDGQRVNGKSIMGVLMLVASVGSVVTIDCKGPQADDAGAALVELIENRFGEGE